MTNEVKKASLNSQRIYKICTGFIGTGLMSKGKTADGSVHYRRSMKTEQLLWCSDSSNNLHFKLHICTVNQ